MAKKKTLKKQKRKKGGKVLMIFFELGALGGKLMLIPYYF